ncbi:MAG: hypothetical protein JNM02_09250 [Anaerolineales bacterium]|nr:hypothetical protein [Anaerolineales bacterium]
MKNLHRVNLLPRIQDIFFIAIFFAVLLLGSRMLNLDGDLPRHLLMGKLILQTGEVPTSEQFIHPYLGRHYVTHEWLADVIFYGIYKFTGLKGIVLFSAIMLATTFFLIYQYITVRFQNRLGAFFLVTWGALATSLNWATRPHLFSMLFLAIWLIWADKLRRGEKIPLWIFPVFMLVWSNAHGVFIAGILVLFAYAVGWGIDILLENTSVNKTVGKNIWLALILSVLASLLNPGGSGSWESILGFVNNQYLMSRMLESNPPNFQLPEMRILLGLIMASIFLLAAKKEKISSGQGLLLAGFTAMSLIAFRNVHLFGVVAPFVLAETLSTFSNIPFLFRLEASLQRVESQIKGSFWIVASTLLIGILVLSSTVTSRLYQFNRQIFPVSAVEWLKENPQEGKMFNYLNWGGYISFNLWPEQMAFIDSVADVTGEVTMEYETVIRVLPGWESILSQYDIQWIIIPPNSLLAKTLTDEAKWSILYEDNTAAILRK